MRDEGADTVPLIDAIRAAARVVPEIRLIGEDELNQRVYESGKRKRAVFFDLR